MPVWLARYGHAQLLAALALLLFVNPFLEGLHGGLLVDLLLWITFTAAVVACATRRWQVVLGLVLTLVLAVAGAYRNYTDVAAIDFTYSILGLAFSAFLTSLILLDVFSGGSVDSDKIFGALSGYLFLGITWAFAYALLEGAEPGSFDGLGPSAEVGSLVSYYRFAGFSLVTITTLGYGNVVPVTARGEALCTAEAIVGQVYLTVLVARLVALSIRSEEEKP